MELSDRKLKILKAIIDDYIDTGVPVGCLLYTSKRQGRAQKHCPAQCGVRACSRGRSGKCRRWDRKSGNVD